MALRRTPSPSLFDTPLPRSVSSAPSREQGQAPLTVGGLTKAIRGLLESTFNDVVVEGEISNFTDHRSGHRYWTLKDSDASISCVFWKTRTANFDIKDGMKVVCRGKLSVYPPRGAYQLDVLQVRPVGIGELQKALEALQKKLHAEGLFDPSRKRPIPDYPKVLGIVTSETGAALHDILTVLRRRYPLVRVLLRPATVQGVGAELEIARAIQEFNLVTGKNRPDVLIVGRGGGSLEDLWSFNEEAVARAIFASQIPIISAVGHEVDVTIADMVADLRAPTPTAAAELATPDIAELLQNIQAMSYGIRQSVLSDLRQKSRALEHFVSGYALNALVVNNLNTKRERVENLISGIRTKLKHSLEKHHLTLDRDLSRLKVLSPYAVLERGYALLETTEGDLISRKSTLDDKSIREAVLVLLDGKVGVRFGDK
ncbi:MAG: exodeoxyribonuclease VII large subunit [Candidatus Kapaibacterium sp.]|jgi:exodeoxyribonuclease VII large subunit